MQNRRFAVQQSDDCIIVRCAVQRVQKSRKRCYNVSQGSQISAPTDSEFKRARLSEASCLQLRDRGFAVLQPFRDTSFTLEVAAKALQRQLRRCHEQPEEERCAGFRSFSHKQLEHHAGTSVLHSPPIMQHITAEVSPCTAHPGASALTVRESAFALPDHTRCQQAVQTLDDLATGLGTDIAEMLNLQPGILNSLHATAARQQAGAAAASSLETIHYMTPSMTRAALDARTSASCEVHVDKGLLTLIFSDTVQGLQVQTHATKLLT